jgi:hypothetical protein
MAEGKMKADAGERLPEPAANLDEMAGVAYAYL